jgi:hypothetical protein
MNSIILLASLNLAEAKKSKSTETPNVSETPAEATKAPKKKEMAANVPKDKVSQAYAATLLETVGTNFSPNAMGLTYSKITFAADNTWKADAVVAIMDEEMDCVETGTWNMDPATSDTKANMSWVVTNTDCPSRVAPIELRLEVVLTGTDAGIYGNFR